MWVELIEEIHDGVCLQRGGADDDVFLRLGAMAAVRPALLLTLHPRVRQLLKLSPWKHTQSGQRASGCKCIDGLSWKCNDPKAQKLKEN